MQAKFQEIVRLQVAANQAAVGSDAWWTDQTKYSFASAIRDEVVEAAASGGWTPWWKKSSDEVDMHNLQLELVDILHFHISLLLQETSKHFSGISQEKVVKMVVAELIDGYNGALVTSTLKWDVSDLNGYLADAINADERCTESLFQLILNSGMSFALMYGLYIGKNVLNVFRANNGYKQDRHMKYWAVRLGADPDLISMKDYRESGIKPTYVEDNEFMVKRVRELVEAGESINWGDFYQEVGFMYAAHTGKRWVLPANM